MIFVPIMLATLLMKGAARAQPSMLRILVKNLWNGLDDVQVKLNTFFNALSDVVIDLLDMLWASMDSAKETY